MLILGNRRPQLQLHLVVEVLPRSKLAFKSLDFTTVVNGSMVSSSKDVIKKALSLKIEMQNAQGHYSC